MARLRGLLERSRRTEADLVEHIGEVDARRLYAREATPSMFVYCTTRLGLSEAEAYLRIEAGRLGRRFPRVLDRVEFTASAELRQKLEELRALMRSADPDADLAAVIEAAVTEKLERRPRDRRGDQLPDVIS